jgi:dTDP-glucose 4,6-dehydratase
MIFVTGGAGFIGSNFLRLWIERDEPVINIDRLTYAGNPANLTGLDPSLHTLHKIDICDGPAVASLFATQKPRAIVHFAAESHVDRSILGPEEFVRTNVVGTFTLLNAALAYWKSLSGRDQSAFRFINVSTDEVFGSLEKDDPPFSESTPYAPNSPYSASKAAADHLVRAYFHTYGLPTITSNCSNNYGPFQFPEKLIPLMVLNALTGKALPVYGDGQNIRDWLYVRDHCTALLRILDAGVPGQTYSIGGSNEVTNLEVVNRICEALQQLRPEATVSYAKQIAFVKDRPGHDRRYAIDSSKIRAELGWAPEETFETGLIKTVEWYLSNRAWCDDIASGNYLKWIDRNYTARESMESAS